MATATEIRRWQQRLKQLGLYTDRIDGIEGRNTRAAVRAFQRLNGLRDDGIVGPKTLAELFPPAIPARDEDKPLARERAASRAWPRQSECTAFYGPPAGRLATAGVVNLPIPFRIAWNLNQRVSTFRCHSLVAEPMQRIFGAAVLFYGEAEYRRLGLDLFGGCYAPRKMRGGNAWSMHAYGIAYDVDPVRNQLRWGRDRAELAKSAYEPFWRIVESEGAVSLGRARNFDWMHFQFARL